MNHRRDADAPHPEPWTLSDARRSSAMFDESMHIRDGDELHLLTMLVRDSSRLPLVFEWWMAELARDHLRLGVYFRAAALMLQIPGAAGFDRVDREDDEIWRQVGESDPGERSRLMPVGSLIALHRYIVEQAGIQPPPNQQKRQRHRQERN